jgi:hypothetical protein
VQALVVQAKVANGPWHDRIWSQTAALGNLEHESITGEPPVVRCPGRSDRQVHWKGAGTDAQRWSTTLQDDMENCERSWFEFSICRSRLDAIPW